VNVFSAYGLRLTAYVNGEWEMVNGKYCYTVIARNVPLVIANVVKQSQSVAPFHEIAALRSQQV